MRKNSPNRCAVSMASLQPQHAGNQARRSCTVRRSRGRTVRPQLFSRTRAASFPSQSWLPNPPSAMAVAPPAIFLRPRKEAGEEGWARPDISAVAGIATRMGRGRRSRGCEPLAGRAPAHAGRCGRRQVNLDFYGLGLDPSFDQKVRYSLQFNGAVQTNWQRAQVAVSDRVALCFCRRRSEAARPACSRIDRPSSVSLAPTAIVEYDSRDSVLRRRGESAETSYLASRESLGASVDFSVFRSCSDGGPSRIKSRSGRERAMRGLPMARRSSYDPTFNCVACHPCVIRVTKWRHWSWRRWRSSAGGASSPSEGGHYTYHPRCLLRYSERRQRRRRLSLRAGPSSDCTPASTAHSPGTTAVYFQVGNAWFRRNLVTACPAARILAIRLIRGSKCLFWSGWRRLNSRHCSQSKRATGCATRKVGLSPLRASQVNSQGVVAIRYFANRRITPIASAIA